MRAIAGWVDWVTIRYGYRPERTLYFAFVLWLSGWGVAHTQAENLEGQGVPFLWLFSLDRLVPLISFSRANGDVKLHELAHWSTYYFYAHIALGYIIGGLLLTAIARLTGV